MITAIALLFFSITSWASGNSVENGGDIVAFEFTNTARLAVKNLKTIELPARLRILVNRIEKSIETVQVNSAPFVELRGEEVNASNDPSLKKIRVNQRWWLVAKRSGVYARMGFVIHEYVKVSKMLEAGYGTSGDLVAAMKPDFYATLIAQESYLNALEGIAHIFRYYRVDAFPDGGDKEVCLIAGEASVRIESVNQTVSSNSDWFHSDKIDTYSQALATVAKELRANCLSREVNYGQLQQSYNRGEDLLYYMRELMFSH